MRALSKLILASTALIFSLAPLQAQANWSPANVKGSYAFRLIGLDTVATKSWIVGTGILIADGGGDITGGSITYNDGGDVCIGTVNSVNKAYTVATDGEGKLTLTFTPTSGTCPIQPTFVFAIALALPKAGIAQTIEMNTTSVNVNGDNSSAVMIYGVDNLL